MKDLNFNIYGFARPTTTAEFSSLLREAVRLTEELDAQIDTIGTLLQAQERSAAADA